MDNQADFDYGVIGGHWYQERLNSLINRCSIALILCEQGDFPELLETITEDIAWSASELVNDYCIEDSEDIEDIRDMEQEIARYQAKPRIAPEKD